MSSSNLQARRATVDDLAELRKLWHAAGLSISALEKRVTEFQVIETPQGGVLAAVGLQMQAQQGKLHSEVCTNLELAEAARERLWERIQAVARNNGLYRIWAEAKEPSWKLFGFAEPSLDLQKKLPPEFGASVDAWLVLKLRDETAPSISLEHEFEAFTLAQRESSERVIRQAQVLKQFAYAFLFGALALGVVFVGLSIFPSSSWSRWFKSKEAPTQPVARPTNSLPATPAQ